LITSPDYDKRDLGRAAMMQGLKTKPEMIPFFQKKLTNLKRGCQPHECLSVSLSEEIIVLLQNSRFMEIVQEQGVEKPLIDWLPRYMGVVSLGNKYDSLWGSK
jgi:hypothetical protein